MARFCANCGTPFATDAPVPAAAPEALPRPQGPALQPTVPYASSVAAPAAGYGGFWIRFVAVVIDALIVFIALLPLAGILALIIGLAGGAVSMPGFGIHLVRGIVLRTLYFVVGWSYEAGMESSVKQATLGKMAMGLKVTDEQGNRISFARATGRHFAKIISGMILLIGYIMAGFTARKQALHDMIAGTLVIRTL
jgi:uncharacterized RDD family membrane protein YckC